MSKFDVMAGLGITLTRRPLTTLGEEEKATSDAVKNYGNIPPETKESPNTRYRDKPDPKYGENKQTTASVTAAQLRTGKPANSNAD